MPASQLTQSKGRRYVTWKRSRPWCSDIIRDQRRLIMFVKQQQRSGGGAKNTTGRVASGREEGEKQGRGRGGGEDAEALFQQQVVPVQPGFSATVSIGECVCGATGLCAVSGSARGQSLHFSGLVPRTRQVCVHLFGLKCGERIEAPPVA